jgi:hypothetical protein
MGSTHKRRLCFFGDRSMKDESLHFIFIQKADLRAISHVPQPSTYHRLYVAEQGLKGVFSRRCKSDTTKKWKF